jgi:hypothetical protein
MEGSRSYESEISEEAEGAEKGRLGLGILRASSIQSSD